MQPRPLGIEIWDTACGRGGQGILQVHLGHEVTGTDRRAALLSIDLLIRPCLLAIRGRGRVLFATGHHQRHG